MNEPLDASPIATDELTQPTSSAGDDASATEKQESNAGNDHEAQPTEEQRSTEQREQRVDQILNRSTASIVTSMAGNHCTTISTVVNHATSSDATPTLESFITVASLHAARRSYKSLDSAALISHSGLLLSERILLLSCHDEDIAGDVAKHIAFESRISCKNLVTIDQNCQGNFNFKHFIASLTPPTKGSSTASPNTVCVWEYGAKTDDDISVQILDSLMSSTGRMQQYQSMLGDRGLCLICVIPPQRFKDYLESHSSMQLRSLEIDFLNPLLEQHDVSDYESLSLTITQQRKEMRWSSDNAKFYKEVIRHLRAGTLPEVVANRPLQSYDDFTLAEMFEWEDPLVRTVLYCATYFPDLSSQDFSFLVELFVGDATEELTRTKTPVNADDKPITVTESVPLLQRWQRKADTILQQCKLTSVRNQDGRRVIDFKLDGLRNRLEQYIRTDQCFFFEAKFQQLRERGLLFNLRKTLAEAARSLFVDIATQHSPVEVANWLFEVFDEFEQAAVVADKLRNHPQFCLLPDLNVKAARRYLCFGMSRLLILLNKEEALREAARIFWQQLLRFHPESFLNLLRGMGAWAPPETVKWLKQLVNNSPLRKPAHNYLVNYLLHRESTILPTLTELMEWTRSSPAGQLAQGVLITYCVETNRQVSQPDYGKWPSAHPLFAYTTRAEAETSLDLLFGWVCSAASEVDRDKAAFIVADILAGWYFVLTPLVAESDSQSRDDQQLSASVVRQLLFEAVTRNSNRTIQSLLAAVWEQFREEILDEVVFIDAIINHISEYSVDAELMANADTARRKLLDAKSSLGTLRTTFITSTAKSIAKKSESIHD